MAKFALLAPIRLEIEVQSRRSDRLRSSPENLSMSLRSPRRRAIVLPLGFFAIVTGAMAVRHWASPKRVESPPGNHALAAEGPSKPDRNGANDPATSEKKGAATRKDKPKASAVESGSQDRGAERRMADDCRDRAKELQAKLDDDCALIVRSPFIVAGDMTKKELESWYRRTIQPAAEAMSRSYFRVGPDEPITILLFSEERTYDQYALRLFDDEGVSVYGYYKPGIRTLVMNIGTGGGTLVHELTHALVDFDFPRIPTWFNEGLASLHEQCRFREDGSGIEGLVNWRLKGLKQAIEEERLAPLAELIEGSDFRGEDVSLNYAQARYLCLYLQKKDLLVEFYSRFRGNFPHDPNGLTTLRELFSDDEWKNLDADYVSFVESLTD